MLYATMRARQLVSITFVRRSANPMNVRKTNVVSATPSRVEESGESAVAG